jgi:hypothetical protein
VEQKHPTIKTGNKPYTVGWKKVSGKWRPTFHKKKVKRQRDAGYRSWKEEQERLDDFERAVADDK